MKTITHDTFNYILAEHKLFRQTKGEEDSIADFSNTDLSYFKGFNTFMTFTNFEGADLSYANLNYIHLEQCNLRGAVLTNTKLEHVNLRGAIGDGKRIRTLYIDNGDDMHVNNKTINFFDGNIQVGPLCLDIASWEVFDDTWFNHLEVRDLWKLNKEKILAIAKTIQALKD